MRFQTKWMRVAFSGFMIVAISSTGCKSGWKMPGKDMFSWGRKPSETTIAGTGPSTTYPKSPALASTPTQIPNSSSTKPIGMNSFASTGSSGMGAAAAANGYQTGPYGTSSSAMTQTPSVASAQPNSSGPYGTSTFGAPNPYGPANTSTPAANPSYAYNGAAGNYSLPSRPTGIAGAATNTAGTTGTYGPGQAASFGAGQAGNYGAPASLPAAATAMTNSGSAGFGMPTYGPANGSPQVYGQPSTGLTSTGGSAGQSGPYTPASTATSAGAYAGANQYPGAGYQAANPYTVQPNSTTGNPYVAMGTSATGTAGAPTTTANVPATANPYAVGGTTPASYSPGSTQRPTVYSNNFAQPSSGGATSAGGYSTPTMASPSYMAPPSNLTR
jgi:hypothetical protein